MRYDRTLRFACWPEAGYNGGTSNRVDPFLTPDDREEATVTVHDFVQARLYEDEDEVVQDALRYLLRERPDLRIGLAVYRYQAEELSPARAAARAGVSWAQMKQLLLERGIQPRLGPETVEEAEEDAAVLHLKEL